MGKNGRGYQDNENGFFCWIKDWKTIENPLVRILGGFSRFFEIFFVVFFEKSLKFSLSFLEMSRNLEKPWNLKKIGLKNPYIPSNPFKFPKKIKLGEKIPNLLL